jgi:DNA-binding NarL/FixJ family response regulator
MRILIADDHAVFRNGLRELLEEAGMCVVADVQDGASCLREAAVSHPDVVLLDLNMPGMSGVETARELRRAVPDARILMLTVSPDPDDVVEALIAGAAGYLLKGAEVEEILLAVRATARGESSLSPRIATDLVRRVRAGAGHSRDAGALDPPPDVLTPREQEILRLLAEGLENAEIGRVLHVSASTVKAHVSSTLAKLGVENRLQAAVYAARAGIA